MTYIGYRHLVDHLGLDVPPLRRPAQIRPLTRVEAGIDRIGVPAWVAPRSEDPIEHLLFALKHEGVQLGVLMPALRKIDGQAVIEALRATPTGAYARILGLLWESANNKDLIDLPPLGGNFVSLFEQDRYVTGPIQRSAKWRIDFNGLGSLRYCITIERTAAIVAGMTSQLPERVKSYAAGLSGEMRDRALTWAYLSETRDSYAIERETPSEDKARLFVQLLREAHKVTPLTERYLTELRQATVTNRLDIAVGFRTEQNYLHSGLQGAAGITYVPPPPELSTELMTELMNFTNFLPAALDPIVAASLVSFGFVFIHPYMDGNGRLSRFLFHYTLCKSGALPNGLILPISVAMKKNERDYLDALQTFSHTARDAWDVRWGDGESYSFRYRWDDDFALYRYWDATSCVEFGYRMAEQALQIELRDEVEFLMRYDQIVRSVDERYDIRGSDLAHLTRTALTNNGHVSNHRRKQFAHVPAEVFEYLESAATAAMAGEPPGAAPPPPVSSIVAR